MNARITRLRGDAGNILLEGLKYLGLGLVTGAALAYIAQGLV